MNSNGITMRIFSRAREISYSELMQVYSQSNQETGVHKYPHLDNPEQQIEAEQDFFAFIKLFMNEEGCFVAVLERSGHYLSCVRVEPYKDGVLISGLETSPQDRNKGYGTMLLQALVMHLSEKGIHAIYSHVSRDNLVSLCVHKHCGFDKISDYAVFVDGSVDYNTLTLKKNAVV